MIEIRNLAEVFDQLDAWTSGVETLAEKVVKGIATDSFNHLLFHSPQYSGDFAANWRMSVNQINTTFVPLDSSREGADGKWDLVFNLYDTGSAPAIEEARNRNRGNLSSFKLGDTIFIANSSSHDESYAPKIEADQISWRPDSHNSGRPIAITVGYIGQRYGVIDKTQADKLSGMTL